MKKILMSVDYTDDFANPMGALPVENADKLAPKIQERIDSPDYFARVYTFDTHTVDKYFGSDEQKVFPNIHGEFGTKGWNFYKIKPRYEYWDKFVESRTEPFEMFSTNDEFFFTKDVFNIWDGNTVYPEWFEKTFPKDEFEIDIVGVAQNYCCFMNIMGLIERNYTVNLIQNCVEGIKNFPDGSVDDSFEENNKIMVESGVNFI